MSDRQIDETTRTLLEVRRFIEESPAPHKACWTKSEALGVCLEGALVYAANIGSLTDSTVTKGDPFLHFSTKKLRSLPAYKVLFKAAKEKRANFIKKGSLPYIALYDFNDNCENKQDVLDICDRALEIAAQGTITAKVPETV